MPLAERIVTPQKLSRKSLDNGERFDLGSVSNNTLVCTLKQLSDLAGHAEEIFSELTSEFTLAVERTNRLRTRVEALNGSVSKLNARAVKVPQGDLDSYANFSKHYSTDNSYKGNLLANKTQPDCIQRLYQEAEDNPVSIIRQCNPNRTDGRTGSKLFMLVPVFKDGVYKESDADFEVKPSLVPQIEHELLNVGDGDDKPVSPPPSPDVEHHPRNYPEAHSQKDKVRKLSKSIPEDLILIDVTGATFNRMCEYRESIRSSSREYIKDGTVKRKHRRQTLSSAPGLVFSEISTKIFNMNHLSSHVSLRTRSMSHERPKSAALECYAPRTGSKADLKKIKEREKKKAKQDPEESNLARSCSLRRSLKSLFKNKRSKSSDLWAEGRPRSPGPPVVDLAYPMKRARSLPRSLKSTARLVNDRLEFDRERSASTEGRLDTRTEEQLDTMPVKPANGQKGTKERSKMPRSVSHNAALSGSTFVDHLSRPKSMEVGPQAFSGTLYPGSVSSQTAPSSESVTSSFTQDSHMTTSKHIHINIPDKPWTKPFAKVKLRFRRKQKHEVKDERQSSSGHWSASSSSARHSLDSDGRRSASSPERLSFCDKDSAVSLNIHSPERCTGKISEEASTFGDGDSSTLNGSSSGNESIVDMKNDWMKKEHWPKTMPGKRVRDITQTSTTVSNRVSDCIKSDAKVTSESCLTTQNLKVHNDVHQPLSRGFSHVGDDESSIYSVDQEGFYTSMHKDCGLRKGVEDLLEEDEDNFSSSTISDGGGGAANNGESSIGKKFSSFISRNGTVKRKKGNKKPPPPPRRMSALSDKNNCPPNSSMEVSAPKSELQKLAELAQRIAAQKEQEAFRVREKEPDRSPSFESDAESMFARVQTKSVISPSAIPSLCSVTPFETDDEDFDLLGFNNGCNSESNQDAIKFKNYMDSLKSSRSAPETMDSSTLTESSFSSMSLDVSPTTASGSGHNLKDSGHYSTWPRSPNNKHDNTKQSRTAADSLKPPECLTIISPKPNLFYADEKFTFVDSRHPLPEAKTPDSILDERVFDSPTNNTFKAPQETSTPATGDECWLPVFDTPSVNSVLSGQRSADSSRFSEKSADWTLTWPRRKGVTFLTSTQPMSKDDCLILTNRTVAQKSITTKQSNVGTFPRKGDHAHFISMKNRQAKVPTSLPVNDQSSEQHLQPAHAKLVISSPVANRACFVENPYKRSVCSPVTANDLLKFWNYTSSDKWYNTLPRSSRPDVKQSFSFSTTEDLQNVRNENQGDVPAINQIPKSLTTDLDFGKPVTLDEDPANSKRPPSKPLFPSISAMKHSVNFPGAPKKRAEPTNYGRTWYDGIDAASTVVVMSPDGTQSLRGTQTSFAAFLKDQASGTSIATRRRRDSVASSISTNSSSSGRKSVTFASVHRTSSSSLSRTSLDATSITSSQLSGDTINDRRSLHSMVSDDGIQVTPQKKDVLSLFQSRDPPHFLSSCLKRSNSNGSSELRANLPPLETIIGSDSETPHNLSEDQSFDESTVCTCDSPPSVPSTLSGTEPSAKRQKVNTGPKPGSLSPRHRSGSPSKPKNLVVSTSFVGSSVKMDPAVTNVICEFGNEIKPMPLITTSFIGAFKMENTSEKNAESTPSMHAALFPNKIIGSQDAKHSKSMDFSPSSEPTTVDVSQPKFVVPLSNKTKQDNEKSSIVAVRMNSNGSLPRQDSVPNKLSSFGPEVKTSAEQASNIDSFGPVVDISVTLPSSSISSSSSSSSSSSTISSSSSSSASLVLAQSSLQSTTLTLSSQCVHTKSVPVLSSTSVMPTSSSAMTTKIVSSTSPPPSSSSTTSSSSSAAATTVSLMVLKPSTSRDNSTAAKFVLPKLRPWNPPNLSNSRTSTLLSQLSAVATQGANLDPTPEVGNEKTTVPRSNESNKGASNESGKPSKKPKDNPAGERTSGSSNSNCVQSGSKAPDESASSKKLCSGKEPKSPDRRDNGEQRSISDMSSDSSSQRDEDRNASHLSRSSCSLNRWSTADIGSSALSLARSTSSLAGLSLSTTSLNKSCLSLAKSTDSLGSSSSTAERSRVAKLTFFNNNDIGESPRSSLKGSVDRRFAKYSGAQKKTNSAKVGQTHEPQQSAGDGNDPRAKSAPKTPPNSSQHSSGKRSLPLRLGLKCPAPKSSPIQGKFVNSILGKLHRKGINTSLTKISQTATAQK